MFIANIIPFFSNILDKKDDKELEEYIKHVSLVLAPNHYLLLDAKQRLAGVLRDIINREPRPTKKVMRRKIELCMELLPVLETLSPGICRIKGKKEKKQTCQISGPTAVV